MIRRLVRVVRWLILFMIITSGGWFMMILVIENTPDALVADNPVIGIVWGISWIVGSIVSMIFYWVVTGTNPIDKLMGE